MHHFYSRRAFRAAAPFIKPFLFTLVCLVAFTFSSYAAANTCSQPVFKSQGKPEGVNSYSVRRNGKKIGTNTVSFWTEGNQLRVVSETRMKVKILFVTVYKYHYRSEEIWCAGALQSVATTVNDNGDKINTTVTRQSAGFLLEGPDGREDTATSFVTTNHWNTRVLKIGNLFNTISGKLNAVTITAKQGQEAPLQEYTVRGELDINTFYENGHWIGMRFKHTDGSDFEFWCDRCKNTPVIPS